MYFIKLWANNLLNIQFNVWKKCHEIKFEHLIDHLTVCHFRFKCSSAPEKRCFLTKQRRLQSQFLGCWFKQQKKTKNKILKDLFIMNIYFFYFKVLILPLFSLQYSKSAMDIFLSKWILYAFSWYLLWIHYWSYFFAYSHTQAQFEDPQPNP